MSPMWPDRMALKRKVFLRSPVPSSPIAGRVPDIESYCSPHGKLLPVASCLKVARGSCCRRSTHALSKRKHDIPRRLLQRFHRNVEVCGVHHTVALKLHPHAIRPCARENHIELNVGSTIGDERMCVDKIDQIVAGRQHVSPDSKVLLQSIAWIDSKTQLSVLSGQRLR